MISNTACVSECLQCYSVVANVETFHIVIPGTKNSNISINIDCELISSSSVVMLLGVGIDEELSFDPHTK